MEKKTSENHQTTCSRGQILKSSLAAGATILALGAPGYVSAAQTHAGPEDRPEQASAQFLKSMNCSRAILETYAPSMGMPTETARRDAAAFAGSMGMGSECGAVTGALMVIGMRYGKVTENDSDADGKTFGRVTEFVKEFRSRHRHTGCSALLGVDMSTPEGVKEAETKGLFTSACPGFVRTAAEIPDRIVV
jgi:C_GCAxxG_C_C family probable redox protein